MNNSSTGTPDIAVIIPAAGSGVRLAAGLPKALFELAGKPLLSHVLERIAGVGRVGRIVVAAPPSHLGQFQQLCSALPGPAITVLPGGEDRRASVRLALDSLSPAYPVILVHDAARALAPSRLFERVAEAVRQGYSSVVPGLPVCDTVRRVVDGAATQTIDRAGLHAIQTPQGFDGEALRRAHRLPVTQDSLVVTDDAGLLERLGYTTHIVPGEPSAFKLTHPSDVPVARLWLEGSAAAM